MENLNNLEKALIDEIDMILDCNFEQYEPGIDLSKNEKLELSREIICEEDQLWEDLNYIIIDKIKNILKKRLRYLEEEDKVCSLDKTAYTEMNILREYVE